MYFEQLGIQRLSPPNPAKAGVSVPEYRFDLRAFHVWHRSFADPMVPGTPLDHNEHSLRLFDAELSQKMNDCASHNAAQTAVRQARDVLPIQRVRLSIPRTGPLVFSSHVQLFPHRKVTRCTILLA